MRVLWLQCSYCKRQGKIAWPMHLTTLRFDILPRTRCSRCNQPAGDMRVIWETDANALDGARTVDGPVRDG